MGKILGAIVIASLAVGGVACGDEDALRQRVQDLEGERAELVTMNEKLKMDNEELQTRMLELQAEVETLRVAVMPPDTVASGSPSTPLGQAVPSVNPAPAPPRR